MLPDVIKEKAKEQAKEEAQNKFQHNGQTVVPDGGEQYPESNVRRRNELRYDDERHSVEWLRSIFSTGYRLASKAIIPVLILGLIGGGILMFSGGGGYMGLLGDMFGSETSQAGNAFSDFGEVIGFQAGKFGKTLSCFGDAGCIKEWELNNTQEPGSNDVGETYELRVDGFNVFGADQSFDVAYQAPGTGIPISFLLKNTRHQLKGIDARNVSYRLRITETKFASGSDDQCSSGWISLQKYGQDVDGLGEGNANNLLLPGESAEPLNWQEEDMSLADCGLLQPGPSNSFDALLQVKYNYSSHSILQIDAMSNRHRNEENIERDRKNSDAVDTPVQSYIATRNPMTFSEVNGDRIDRPQQFEVGISTDENDVSYKVDAESFEFKDSSLTDHVESECSGLVKADEGGENMFELNKSVKEDIGDRQEDSWFDKRSSAVKAFCNFEFNDPEEISATGETLTFTAEADYQLKLSEHRTSFKVRNTRCTTENCPMLKPVSENLDTIVQTDLDDQDINRSSEDYRDKQYAICGRPQDDEDGCSVLKNGFKDRSSLVEENREEESRENGADLVVEEGNIAVKTSAIDDSKAFTCDAKQKSFNNSVVQFEPDELIDAIDEVGNKALNYSRGDWDMVDLEKPGITCK
ncbi:hypothetical protein LC1Nh_0912 [Candidatus Nanohalobium constans]|uniref:Uncharacterized protein n=2 Tax=Candidatus Nanohalobium constans TaxID=2565781 RepID=A0A5Q0UGS9_9ARCH|nr:hypothetical protein LC1Nh_0912 [Candidatus Nanohalobium constans]